MRRRCFVWLLLFSITGLIVSVALHETTGLDRWVQDSLYDFQAGRWVVDKNAPVPRLFFYNLPKFSVVGVGALLVVSLILDRVRGRADTYESRRRFYLVLCLILIPVTVALWKRYSGVFCPAELTWYGGRHDFRLLFQSRPAGVEVGHCFPGGHASAGFSLVAFALLPRRTRHRWMVLLAALVIGWVMGFYQMAKGAHFLTHTLTTMFTATTMSLLLGVWLLRDGIPLTGRPESTPEEPTVAA